MTDQSTLKRLADAKDKVDLVEMIGREVALSKGRRFRHGPCPFCGDAPGSTAFWVDVRAQRFGCFKGEALHRGDVFDWLRLTRGLSLDEACETILGRAGIERLAAAVAPQAERGHAVSAPEDRDVALRRAAAVLVWRQSLPAQGTAVERYLAGRGIEIAIPASLRFHPGLEYTPLRQYAPNGRSVLARGPVFPSMVALVIDASRRIRGVHRTFLKADGSAKAAVESPKRMLGDVRGGFVPLAPLEADSDMGEGIESALSILQDGGRPVAACLSLNNWDAALPSVVRAVTLCVDMDEKYRLLTRAERRQRARDGKPMPDPEDAIRAAVAAHAARGLTVRVARPPLGMDFNDLLLAAKRGEPIPCASLSAAGPAEIARRYGLTGEAA